MTNAESLTQVVAEIAATLPGELANHVADRIAALAMGPSDTSLVELGATAHARELMRRLARAWLAEPETPPRAVALAITSASEAIIRASPVSVETVVTGPSTEAVHARRTEQVVLELIDTAVDSLWIVSYVAYNIPNVLESLRLAISRGCTVKMLLEVAQDAGGTLDFDSLEIIREEIPGSTILLWPMSKRGVAESGASAILHAKCLIADAKTLYLSSANLTPNAQDVNMELGAVIRGGETPGRVFRHFEELHARGDLVSVE